MLNPNTFQVPTAFISLLRILTPEEFTCLAILSYVMSTGGFDGRGSIPEANVSALCGLDAPRILRELESRGLAVSLGGGIWQMQTNDSKVQWGQP